MQSNENQPNGAAPRDGLSPKFAMMAYSLKTAVVGINEVMRAFAEYREWLAPIEFHAREGESKFRVKEALILGQQQSTPGEVWIFTDAEAALLAQAQYPLLGVYGGGMSGAELFDAIPPATKVVRVNPFSPDRCCWSFQDDGIDDARVWAQAIQLEERLQECEQTGAFDEQMFYNRLFTTFNYDTGEIVTLPYQNGDVKRALVFTTPDCADKFLSQMKERHRPRFCEVRVEGESLLEQFRVIGVDGFVVNVSGPGTIFVHDFAQENARPAAAVQTPVESN